MMPNENSTARLKMGPYFVLPILLIIAGSARAQTTQMSRLGILSAYSPAADRERIDALLQGLRKLGHVVEKNLLIEYRYIEGNTDRIPKMVAELEALKVNVIVASGGSNLVRTIKQTTKATPIVMTGGSDPVAAGIIASLAHPGGNVTGVTSLTLDLSGKRVELLQAAIPNLLRLGVLYDIRNPSKRAEFAQTRQAASGLGVEIQPLELRGATDLEAVFKATTREQAQGLIALQSPLTVGRRKHIADLAVKGQLPLMVAEKGLLDAGGLMSYGPDYSDMYRLAASYVDKILKGAKPSELPVEQPTKFELVINLKTAKQIALTIPPNVLARADRVIK